MVVSSLLLMASLAPAHRSVEAGPMLLRTPTMNESQIVFAFANDLWRVSRDGGEAIRLTTSPASESNPHFSPDGKTIAFTGNYDGNNDVYTVPVNGGIPKRITYHPGTDYVLGWTPDGRSIVMASGMTSKIQLYEMFTVSANGGVPQRLPFPSGNMASISPDGASIAYVPTEKWQDAWKRYRGGQAYPIWIGRMSDSKVFEIPRKDWNDFNPMWVGNKVYYLSDPNGVVGLSSYDINSKKVTEEVKGEGFDLKSASAGPGGIVYEKLGGLYIFDPATKTSKKVEVSVAGDFPEIRSSIKNVGSQLTGAAISPSGQRLVTSARGWIFTVPAQKGDARVLNEKQGVHRRSPAWSPDGKTISYISDENGRQQMILHDVQTGNEKAVDLFESPAYYYVSGSGWSPDSKKIAYYDNRNNFLVLDVASGRSTKIDQTLFTDPNVDMEMRWSPDSQYITYARDLVSHMQAVFIYSFASGKSSQITDGMAHARSPIFDRDGKHLYFFASTNTGPSLSWLDMSSMTKPMTTSSVYCVVLRNDLPNPLQAESDEEVIRTEGAAPQQPAPPAPFRVDFDGIQDRIISLPIPGGDIAMLEAANPGSFFILTRGPRVNPLSVSPLATISKFTMSQRSAMPFGQGAGITTTPDGSKALVSGLMGLQIVSTMAPIQPGQGAVSLSGMQVRINPQEEWASMFHEIWRNEPMLFYASNLHGIDPEVMRRRYEPFLANIMSRDDLNYLFTDMLGEISIGHMWAAGGDSQVGGSFVPGGLLGADFSFENGRYRIVRVFNGEKWNPGLYAPLAQPGVNAKAGDYLIAIDGKELKDSNDIYQMLEGKANRQVKIKLSRTPDGANAREVTVVPVSSEAALRHFAWIEDNRRYVDQKTGGRAGYVHVPDTGTGGWTAFQRYYYAQVGRDGMIIDERFNQGGLINDYMINEMLKPLDAAFTPRTGLSWPTPGAAIYGPKVMIANEMAGSGGDMFPWLFKARKVGPIVGKRTWGGLVASFGFSLVDGGRINSPNVAFFNPRSGKWEVEGHGVDPDIVVELDPYLWRQGIDAQLERAIEEINKALKNYKPIPLERPANPDKSKRGSGGF